MTDANSINDIQDINVQIAESLSVVSDNEITPDYTYKDTEYTKLLNGANNKYGGAIYINKNAKVYLVDNCVFTGNTSANPAGDVGRGGAVFARSTATDFTAEGVATTLIVKNSTFSDNVSVEQGGAIGAMYQVVLDISNTTFSGNTSAQGGAIYAQGGTVNISKTKFSGNIANSGGAIFFNGSGDSVYTVSDSTFETGKDMVYSKAEVRLDGTNTVNATFTGSSSYCYILVENADLIFNNSSTITMNRLQCEGGNVLNFNGSATVKFSGGTLLSLSGATANLGFYGTASTVFSGYDPSQLTIAIDGEVVELGKKYLNGSAGKIWTLSTNTDKNALLRTSADVTAASGTVIETGLHELKQAALITDDEFNVIRVKDEYFTGTTYSSFANIEAADGVTQAIVSGMTYSSRLGVSASNGITGVIVDRTVFENISSSGNGAAFSSTLNTLITNSDFRNNSTSIEGGAIYVATDGMTLTIENSRFTGNKISSGSGGGGAIRSRNDVDTVICGSTFSGNDARPAENGCGGAIYVTQEGTLTLRGTTVTGEDGKVAVQQNVFDRNVGRYGGAVYAKIVDISDTEFTKNHASQINSNGRGGAVYIENGATIASTIGNNTVFNGNTAADSEGNATSNGGALYLYKSASAIITGTVKFLTWTDSIYLSGTSQLTVKDADLTLNASVKFETDNNVSFSNSTVTFDNTTEIGFNRAITIDGDDNKFIFTGTERVSFSALDVGSVAITVDAAGRKDGDVIAYGVVGELGEDDAVKDKGYTLEISGKNLILKANLAENSEGSVYGGGSETNDGTNITQTIAAGLKQGTVFAGSEKGVDGKITTTVTGGEIAKHLYGGGKVSAESTELTVEGGTVGQDVYGGLLIKNATNAISLGESNLTVSGGTFDQYVVGGSRVTAADATTTHTVGKVTLTLT
ncbi:MAG: hypothetical protein IKA71_01380, partial [Lentisphaeria bacterium]|nr:hypothetical protein [Lentisphaeria bacterium]